MHNNKLFTFWYQSKLDDFTKVCMRSWLKLGYEIDIYFHESPDWDDVLEFTNQHVNFLNVEDILDLSNVKDLSYQEIADYFRFYHLYHNGGTWVDTDLFLLRRLPERQVIISSEHCKKVGAFSPKNRDFTPNIGLLRFPQHHSICEHTLLKIEKKIKQGYSTNSNKTALMIPFQRWIIAHHMEKVSHPDVFCPISWCYTKEIFKESNVENKNKYMIEQRDLDWILKNSVGIHLWRNIAIQKKYLPESPNSVYSKLKNMLLN